MSDDERPPPPPPPPPTHPSWELVSHIEVFTGDDQTIKVTSFLEQIDLTGALAGWDSKTKCNVARLRLRKQALSFINAEQEMKDTIIWEDFKKGLKEQFKTAEPLMYRLAKYDACKQRPKESVRKFASRLKAVGLKTISLEGEQDTVDARIEELMTRMRDKFLMNLRPEIRRFALSRSQDMSYKECVDIAEQEEINELVTQTKSISINAVEGEESLDSQEKNKAPIFGLNGVNNEQNQGGPSQSNNIPDRRENNNHGINYNPNNNSRFQSNNERPNFQSNNYRPNNNPKYFNSYDPARRPFIPTYYNQSNFRNNIPTLQPNLQRMRAVGNLFQNPNNSRPNPFNPNNFSHRLAQNQDYPRDYRNHLKCTRCNRIGHNRNNCGQSSFNRAGSEPPPARACFRCGNKSHFIRECPNPPPDRFVTVNGNRSNSTPPGHPNGFISTKRPRLDEN